MSVTLRLGIPTCSVVFWTTRVTRCILASSLHMVARTLYVLFALIAETYMFMLEQTEVCTITRG